MNFWTFGLSSLDLTISASVATALSKPIMRESIQRSRPLTWKPRKGSIPEAYRH